MKPRRKFSKEFKRQVVEELLSGMTTVATLCRKHALIHSVLKRWQQDYALGRLENEPTTEAGLSEKVAELERLVGRLTMENGILKKALKLTLFREKRNASLSGNTLLPSKASAGGVK